MSYAKWRGTVGAHPDPFNLLCVSMPAPLCIVANKQTLFRGLTLDYSTPGSYCNLEVTTAND